MSYCIVLYSIILDQCLQAPLAASPAAAGPGPRAVTGAYNTLYNIITQYHIM